MSNVQSNKKKPHELADLILENDPGASLDQIAEVISEWGDLFDDRKFDARGSLDDKPAAPKRRPPSPI
jgi:hypothetical protein